MSDFFHSKGKLSRFLAGKGFYAALAVCVIGAGAAAWVAVDKTVDRIDESNRRAAQPGSQAASSAPEPSYGFPDLEEAGKAQSEASELKREVFRLQQRLDAQNKNRG